MRQVNALKSTAIIKKNDIMLGHQHGVMSYHGDVIASLHHHCKKYPPLTAAKKYPVFRAPPHRRPLVPVAHESTQSPSKVRVSTDLRAVGDVGTSPSLPGARAPARLGERERLVARGLPMPMRPDVQRPAHPPGIPASAGSPTSAEHFLIHLRHICLRGCARGTGSTRPARALLCTAGLCREAVEPIAAQCQASVCVCHAHKCTHARARTRTARVLGQALNSIHTSTRTWACTARRRVGPQAREAAFDVPRARSHLSVGAPTSLAASPRAADSPRAARLVGSQEPRALPGPRTCPAASKRFCTAWACAWSCLACPPMAWPNRGHITGRVACESSFRSLAPCSPTS